MKVVIYYNPRCSKSRATLEVRKSKGIEPQIIEYLKTPPSAEALDRILTLLGDEPRALLRANEAPCRDLGLDYETLSRDALFDALVDHPVLMQRPIVLANGKAAIGRPPERVLAIL